jgi:hypothetical protein
VGVGGQCHSSAALLLEKICYKLCRRLVGPQDRSGRMRKISPSPRSAPRTVQRTAKASVLVFGLSSCSCWTPSVWSKQIECVAEEETEDRPFIVLHVLIFFLLWRNDRLQLHPAFPFVNEVATNYTRNFAFDGDLRLHTSSLFFLLLLLLHLLYFLLLLSFLHSLLLLLS